MNKLNLHRMIPLIVLVFLAYILVAPYIEDSKRKSTEAVELEKLDCITAVCIKDHVAGRECKEFRDSMALITLVKEKHNSDASRLVVELTGKSCSK